MAEPNKHLVFYGTALPCHICGDVSGRRAGSVPDYPYSSALRDSRLVWTDETVDRLFTVGPEVLTPGSKMPLQKIPDPHDRAALIDYLRRAVMADGEE